MALLSGFSENHVDRGDDLLVVPGASVVLTGPTAKIRKALDLQSQVLHVQLASEEVFLEMLEISGELLELLARW